MSRYGRMRASFDSDASLVNSPPMSPPRHGHPVYFVQSPSRDSMQDADSLSQSFSRATPRESPSASPLHHHHHLKHLKQPSAADSLPFGAHTPKPGSRKVLPQPSFVAHGAKKGARAWAPGPILEEEEALEGANPKKRLSRACLVWIALFFTTVMFFAGAFLFWLVTMPKPPHVSVQVAHMRMTLLQSHELTLLFSYRPFGGELLELFPCCGAERGVFLLRLGRGG
jgi:hypothetical protein